MGMFDEIRVINISHRNFDWSHNGRTFQTKSLECHMSEYCVFNGVLYQEVDNSSDEHKRHNHAVKIDYSGELNIYTHARENGIKGWIEYDLIFKSGELVDVVPYDVRVIEDRGSSWWQGRAHQIHCLAGCLWISCFPWRGLGARVAGSCNHLSSRCCRVDE